jgi:hypothetical protein
MSPVEVWVVYCMVSGVAGSGLIAYEWVGTRGN